MRRLGLLALGPALFFAPASSAALALPAPTCSYPEPSFGVMMDEDAIAAGALDEIYVDGVVAVPVRVGLGLATIQSPEELVALGLVNMDVVAEDGSVPAGKLEMALASSPGGTATDGYPAWLIWTGEAPFTPESDYALEFSFLNDALSDCPEAVSNSGTRVFRTGARSAADELAPPNFIAASLTPSYVLDPGCCSTPETDACKTAGKCVACWQSYAQITTAQAIIESPLPIAYFSIAVSFQGGEPVLPVPQNPVYATFSVTEPAEEYCFEAEVRLRAGGEPSPSVTSCVPSTEYARTQLAPSTLELPAEACVDGPLAQRGGQGVVAIAAVAATEAEARAVVEPTPVSNPVTPTQPMPLSPVDVPSSDPSTPDSDGCAMGHSTGSPLGLGLGLLGLLAWLRRPGRSALPNP